MGTTFAPSHSNRTAAAVPLLLVCVCLLFASTRAETNSSDTTTTSPQLNIIKQPDACTEIIADGELVTRNSWVDCSFGSQTLNSTLDGEKTLLIALEPGGVFSLCTRQPFGKVFDDLSIQMWLYTPGNLDDVQLEIMYSLKADGLAYTSASASADFDKDFTEYDRSDMEDLETYSTESLESLVDVQSAIGNWSFVNKDLQEASKEDLARHHVPIYNRLSVRNVIDLPVTLIVDSLVLVKNDTEKHVFVTSLEQVRDSGCKVPHMRLPPEAEIEETFNSMLDVTEVKKQKSMIPVFAGVSSVLFIAAVTVLILSIVFRTQRLRHLYIPFDDLDFDKPPEVIGRGKFGYVLRAYYGGFPVATKLVLPSVGGYRAGAGGNMFEKKARAKESKGHTPVGVIEYVETQSNDDLMDDHDGGDARFRVNESVVHFTYGNDSGVTINSNLPSPTSSTQSVVLTLGSGDSASSTKSFIVGKSLKKEFEKEIRLLMKLRHPNIVTIMGVSKNPVTKDYVLVMERMSKGSLIDCLTNPTVDMEHELLMDVMKDITAGMAYLHNLKPPVLHNDLRAANVLIDENFTAKISDFGLSGRQNFISSSSKWPWTAPEILSGNQHSMQTDVYSFGVLLIEIYSRCRLKVSDMKLVIPNQAPAFSQALIRDCLNPNPKKRPSFKSIQERFSAQRCALNRSSSMIKTRNVMCAQLPANMAEDLKLGKTPSSTNYKCLTLFMSDIVGYTKMASQMSPEALTSMLNCFYHKLDNLVPKHNLFKIETIGDAYIAVGGILQDDDEDHCSRVVQFSEEALRAARETSIPGLTESSIKIRIGIHSGPCIGAVVGQLNPKFSLYGDTVNVVSRLESTGKAGFAHLSLAAAELLEKQNHALARNLQIRGQTELKGKGFMTTFWYNVRSIK